MIRITTVISEDSDETAHIRTLVRAFAACTGNEILEEHINFGLKSGSPAPSIFFECARLDHYESLEGPLLK